MITFLFLSGFQSLTNKINEICPLLDETLSRWPSRIHFQRSKSENTIESLEQDLVQKQKNYNSIEMKEIKYLEKNPAIREIFQNQVMLKLAEDDHSKMETNYEKFKCIKHKFHFLCHQLQEKILSSNKNIYITINHLNKLIQTHEPLYKTYVNYEKQLNDAELNWKNTSVAFDKQFLAQQGNFPHSKI